MQYHYCVCLKIKNTILSATKSKEFYQFLLMGRLILCNISLVTGVAHSLVIIKFLAFVVLDRVLLHVMEQI